MEDPKMELKLSNGDTEVVKELLRASPSSALETSLHLGDEEGNTALHHLIIELLLKCNASENDGQIVQANAINKTSKPIPKENQTDTILIVLTLIALASHQAMVSPPRGIEENAAQFVWFVLCNSIAFFVSIATMWMMVQKSPWCLAVYVVTFGMVSSYHCAVFRASPSGNLRIVAVCVCLVLPFLPFLGLKVKSLRLLSRERQVSGLV